MKTSPKLNRYFKILLLVVFFSFMWGGWWGFYRQERFLPSVNYKDSVRILTLANYLPPEFIAEFQKITRVRLHVTEKNSDIELLREALSHNQDYDLIQITSFIAKSFIIDNVLTPLSTDDHHSLVANLSHASIDFKGMDYDPDNKYLVPITWGLNGFIVNTEKVASTATESLQELLGARSASVLSSPVELFNMITKLKPIIKNWVETGQTTELHRDLAEMRGQLKKFSDDPRPQIKDGSVDVAQLTNGQAAKFVLANTKLKFVLPKDRATMWISYLGVSRGVHDIDTTIYVLNQFLQNKINERLVMLNEQATVVEELNRSALPALQKASYIREVPLSRVELFINHEALEPTWNNALQKDLFKTSK